MEEQKKETEQPTDTSSGEERSTHPSKDSTDKEPKHHVVLLGDSILDNQSYVIHDGPSVIEQLQFKIKDQSLPWKATLLAVDGAVISGVKRQIQALPEDTTVMVMSIGGNNGLGELGRIHGMGNSIFNPVTMYSVMTEFLADFRKRYSENLDLVIGQANEVCSSPVPLILCTIYYPMFEDFFSKTVAYLGLSFVNNIILDEAKKRGLPVIELGTLFDKPQDYANPIEPGVPGGDKITNNIIKIIRERGFENGHQVYCYKDYSEQDVMYATRELAKETEEDRKRKLYEEFQRREALRSYEDRTIEENDPFRQQTKE